MITIIDYGMGNLFSVYNGLKKVGSQRRIVSESDDLGDEDGIIVPGVGAFDDAIRNIKPFSEKLLEVVESGVPVLGICLGMQIMLEESEEGDEKGFGLIPGKVIRLPANVRVPHIGWNSLHLRRNSKLLEGISSADFFYFAHSYHCKPWKERNIIASVEVEYGHDGDKDIAAVISKDNVYGVQFHPEKSSKKGLQILSNFVDICKC